MAPPGEPGGADRTTPRRIPRPKPATGNGLRASWVFARPSGGGAFQSRAMTFGKARAGRSPLGPPSRHAPCSVSLPITRVIETLRGFHCVAPPRRPRLALRVYVTCITYMPSASLRELGRLIERKLAVSIHGRIGAGGDKTRPGFAPARRKDSAQRRGRCALPRRPRPPCGQCAAEKTPPAPFGCGAVKNLWLSLLVCLKAVQGWVGFPSPDGCTTVLGGVKDKVASLPASRP